MRSRQKRGDGCFQSEGKTGLTEEFCVNSWTTIVPSPRLLFGCGNMSVEKLENWVRLLA